jgi:hypothetical protein
MTVGDVLLVTATALGAAAVVVVAVRRRASPPRRTSTRDPFSLSEPWRQLVQGSQRAERRLRSTVESVDPGPLRDRLDPIAERVGSAIEDTWAIARQGDAIDDAVRDMAPTELRSRLGTLETHPAGEHDAAAIESVRRQLETVDRLTQRSDDAAARLRRTQARLDELAARAAEVALGGADTDAYEHDVDDLAIELEALRLAMEDLRGQ